MLLLSSKEYNYNNFFSKKQTKKELPIFFLPQRSTFSEQKKETKKHAPNQRQF